MSFIHLKQRTFTPKAGRTTMAKVGDVYGQLTIIEVLPSVRREDSSGTVVYVRCRCSCGDVSDKQYHNIRSGNTTVCDYLKHRRMAS